MDVKKIGITAGIFIASFLIVFVGVYALYPSINPEAAAALVPEEPEEDFSIESYDPNDFNPEAVTRLRKTIVALQDTIATVRAQEARYLANIDSLAMQVAELVNRKVLEPAKNDENAGPNVTPEQQRQEEEANEKVQEIAKTLLSLDEDELNPIANLLTERQLVDLYSSASKAQREKLLRALKPEKAANILKKVMS